MKKDDFNGPKSICECGHTGDGENSEHKKSMLAEGHGPCIKCKCQQFRWKAFREEYEQYLSAFNR